MVEWKQSGRTLPCSSSTPGATSNVWQSFKPLFRNDKHISYLPDQLNDGTLLQLWFRVYELLQGNIPRVGTPQDSVAVSVRICEVKLKKPHKTE
jgi:hypothetical protein